jgi:hypothetical protein
MSAPAKHRLRLPLIVLGAGAVAVIWGIVAYRPAPALPRDADHTRSDVPGGCLECHAPGGVHPQPPDHPISQACLSCHARH